MVFRRGAVQGYATRKLFLRRPPSGGLLQGRNQWAADLAPAGGAPLDGFRIMCRSAASPAAADIGKRQIEAHYHKALTAALPGAHAAERAALLLAFVAGVQIMRQMIGLEALAKCPPAVLVKLLRPVFQQVWSAPPTDPQKDRQKAPRKTPRKTPWKIARR